MTTIPTTEYASDSDPASGSSSARGARRRSKSWCGGTNRSVGRGVQRLRQPGDERGRRPGDILDGLATAGIARAAGPPRRGSAASRGTSGRTPGARRRGRPNPPSMLDVRRACRGRAGPRRGRGVSRGRDAGLAGAGADPRDVPGAADPLLPRGPIGGRGRRGARAQRGRRQAAAVARAGDAAGAGGRAGRGRAAAQPAGPSVHRGRHGRPGRPGGRRQDRHGRGWGRGQARGRRRPGPAPAGGALGSLSGSLRRTARAGGSAPGCPAQAAPTRREHDAILRSEAACFWSPSRSSSRCSACFASLAVPST